MTSARLVVLASGAGTTLQAVLTACTDPAYGATVVAVGTDRPGTGAEERARAAGIPTWTVQLKDFGDRREFDAAVAARLAADAPALVVFAGYMKILGPAVVRGFRCVNTHPALLPKHPGAHAVRDALAAGDTETGATVHWVDEGVDTGPVLSQIKVPIEPDDDETTLQQRIQAAERPLFVSTIGLLVREIAAAQQASPPTPPAAQPATQEAGS